MTTVAETSQTMTVDRLGEFQAAWNAHDVQRIVSFFTPDGAYLASV
jgi:ketosteroid isomerase-like protein